MKIIIIVLVVVVVALLAGFAVTMMNRKKEQQKRDQSAELRQQAQGRATGLHVAETRVREDEAAAAQARAEAEAKAAEADRLATLAHQRKVELDVERGHQENTVRTADQLDPDVQHTAPDYEPQVPEFTAEDQRRET